MLPLKLAWCTDVHFNFVDEAKIRRLARECKAQGADVALLTGDIAEGNSILRCLKAFQEELGDRVYFVAGNHDFYGTSIEVLEGVLSRPRAEPLTYLTGTGVIPLSEHIALVGDDGWYDARNGNLVNAYGGVTMELWDFTEIAEVRQGFAGGPEGLRLKLHELGSRAAARARPKLEEALLRYKHVIFATHVPPFAGAAWYKGKPSESYAQPFFSSKVMGDMLFELAGDNPDKKITVLCGHSHYYGLYKPDANLEVYTGFAKYYEPCIVRILEVEGDTLTMHSIR